MAAASTAGAGSAVHYIDTTNSFSAPRMAQIASTIQVRWSTCARALVLVCMPVRAFALSGMYISLETLGASYSSLHLVQALQAACTADCCPFTRTAALRGSNPFLILMTEEIA